MYIAIIRSSPNSSCRSTEDEGNQIHVRWIDSTYLSFFPFSMTRHPWYSGTAMVTGRRQRGCVSASGDWLSAVNAAERADEGTETIRLPSQHGLLYLPNCGLATRPSQTRARKRFIVRSSMSTVVYLRQKQKHHGRHIGRAGEQFSRWGSPAESARPHHIGGSPPAQELTISCT